MKSFLSAGLCLIVVSAAAAPGYAAPPTITVLHAFNGTDGISPYAPLVQASDGNFYGTTLQGGDDGHGCVQGCDGTVFKLTPQGQFTLLHTFVGGGTTPVYQNGRLPWGGLVEGPDGYLYGTTFLGGVTVRPSDGAIVPADGTVYKISKTGQFQKIHDFNSFIQPEGGEPQGSLVFGSDGYLYGTTTNPPAFPQVFRMSTAGAYTTVKSLYNTGLGTPLNGLVQASDGNLYGVANGGIYRITPPFGFAPVYFFDTPSDGSGNSEVIQATDGNLYGATYLGPGNSGFAFRLGLDGTHQNILNLSSSTTGVVPNAFLQASDGNLWGTTNISTGGGNGGTVFTIGTDGALLQAVFLTTNNTGVGGRPVAPLVQGIDGKLYGTASVGGPNFNGTVFVVDGGLAPKLMSIAVTAPSHSIANGTSQQFTAIATYGDNSTADVTTQVTWSSSHTGVATIGASTGLATAVGPGSTDVNASLGGVTSNTFALTVVQGNADPVCASATANPSTMTATSTHSMQPVAIANVTDPDGDPVTITVAAICQDEPTTSPGVPGFAVDGAGIGTATPAVRAERDSNRQAPGNGRMYHIFFDASDGRGGRCSGEVKVGVPVAVGAIASDDGATFDSRTGAACVVPGTR